MAHVVLVQCFKFVAHLLDFNTVSLNLFSVLLEVILGVAEVTLKNVNKDVKDVTVKNYNLTYSINEMD